MKLMKPLVTGLAMAFLLAGCGPDDEQNAASPVNNAGQKAVASRLSRDRFIEAALPVTTQDGRELEVSFTAYCEKLNDSDNTKKDNDGLTAYASGCIAYVRHSLEYFAKDRACFEGSVPAVSSDIRNHPGLPARTDDKCYDIYPANYAPWTVETMTRTLEMLPDDNLYTVTAIKPLSP